MAIDIWGGIKRGFERAGTSLTNAFEGIGDIAQGDFGAGLTKLATSSAPGAALTGGLSAVSPEFDAWLANAEESEVDRNKRLSDAAAATQEQEAANAAADQQTASTNLTDFLNRQEDFSYDPNKSETLDIYQRQARRMADAERVRLAQALARSGGSASGASARGSMRISQGQNEAMDRNILNDIQQQYGIYQDKYQRDYQREMAKYNLVQQNYQQALDQYNQALAVQQQNAIAEMQRNQQGLNFALSAGQLALGGGLGSFGNLFSGGTSAPGVQTTGVPNTSYNIA